MYCLYCFVSVDINSVMMIVDATRAQSQTPEGEKLYILNLEQRTMAEQEHATCLSKDQVGASSSKWTVK